MESPESVHRFWFGDAASDAATDAEIIAAKSALWWSKNPAIDRAMASRFAPTVSEAGAGRLELWRAHPLGTLALVLLTDQFPRNIHRDQPAAFGFDVKARQLCRAALAQRYDAGLRPIERVFLYLPLEHSEDLADQSVAVRLYETLLHSLPAELKPDFEGYLDYAYRHRDIIRRFGRFPHRNAILGRPSTEAELAFLAQPGSGF